MLSLIIIALIGYIGWQRYTHRREVDRLLVHAAGLQAEVASLKLEREA